MKHIAAFALLVLGGNDNPSASDIEKVLKEAGVKADSDKIEKMGQYSVLKALYSYFDTMGKTYSKIKIHGIFQYYLT